MDCGSDWEPLWPLPRRVAQKAQGALADIVARIRGSPVVHADETGWREDGHNGYVWTFSTPTERYFLRRGRSKAVVAEALGEEFAGGAGQRLLRRLPSLRRPQATLLGPSCCGISTILRALYPDDVPLGRWADAVHDVYEKAKAFTHPSEWQRRRAQLALEQRLLALCRPYRDDPSAVQAKLCRRVEKHIKELFVFVAETAVPPDNNAAERSLRHLVVSRKVSGGTRSPQGTETKMTLASVFRAPGGRKDATLSPLADNCSFPLKSEQLRRRQFPPGTPRTSLPCFLGCRRGRECRTPAFPSQRTRPATWAGAG